MRQLSVYLFVQIRTRMRRKDRMSGVRDRRASVVNSAVMLLAGMLLTACGKAPQQAFQDGLEAYNKGDFKTAMENWKPIADSGDAGAQTNVGPLYSQGKGEMGRASCRERV